MSPEGVVWKLVPMMYGECCCCSCFAGFLCVLAALLRLVQLAEALASAGVLLWLVFLSREVERFCWRSMLMVTCMRQLTDVYLGPSKRHLAPQV
jgi:hypothetical protein